MRAACEQRTGPAAACRRALPSFPSVLGFSTRSRSAWRGLAVGEPRALCYTPGARPSVALRRATPPRKRAHETRRNRRERVRDALCDYRRLVLLDDPVTWRVRAHMRCSTPGMTGSTKVELRAGRPAAAKSKIFGAFLPRDVSRHNSRVNECNATGWDVSRISPHRRVGAVVRRRMCCSANFVFLPRHDESSLLSLR